MFRFLKTYKLGPDIIMAVVWALTSFVEWRDFNSMHDNWRLIWVIIIGVLAISEIVDVIEDLTKRKNPSA